MEVKLQQRVSLGRLLFTSDFDGGNFGHVEHIQHTSPPGGAAAKQSYEEYAITILPDCAGTAHETSHRTWFYFGILLLPPDKSAMALSPCHGHDEDTPVLEDSAVQEAGPHGDSGTVESEGMTIDIVIRNMNNQSKLFREGYKPWWRRGSNWCRLPDTHETAFSFEWGGEPLEGGSGLSIRWRQRLQNDGSTTYFAFCAPFGHEDCQRLLDTLDGRILEASAGICPVVQDPCWPLRCISVELQEDWAPRLGEAIYFHRQQLGVSADARSIELLTITSSQRQPWDSTEANATATSNLNETSPETPEGKATESSEGKAAAAEDTLPDDLPDAGKHPPRHFIGRPLIFLSARVHPGETPGQFAFLGLMRFLLSADPRARELRERFVFKLVPMLNPDGVARGHHRTNSRGLDLNRCYTNPNYEEHEGVWLTKRILSHWAAQKRLLMVVDFHGHPSRRGCFLLGNKNSGMRQTWNIAFARLCQLNSPHFDIDSCDFEDRAADHESTSTQDCPGKHGTARAAIHRDCQVCHTFTFECNFHSGRSTKPMPPVFAPNEESPGGTTKSQAPVPYDHSCWAQSAEAIGVSILDAYGHNC